jgi:hypothetical protein
MSTSLLTPLATFTKALPVDYLLPFFLLLLSLEFENFFFDSKSKAGSYA